MFAFAEIWEEIQGVKLCPHRFSQSLRLQSKKMLYLYDSKYWSLLLTTYFHLAGSLWIPRQKNSNLFKQITNQSCILALHGTESAGQQAYAPWTKIDNSRKNHFSKNIADGLLFSVASFPEKLWSLLQGAIDQCRESN